MSLVGKKAPIFNAPAIVNGYENVDTFSLDQFIGNKEVVFFFYPKVHMAWLSTPKNKGGIEGVKYPLVADVAKTIAYNYGVLSGDWDYNENNELVYEGDGVAFRGSFFIDKEGIVRHETINDLPLGRNIDEMLRIIDAWHHVEEHGEVCPANWSEGDEAMSATRDGVADYLATH